MKSPHHFLQSVLPVVAAVALATVFASACTASSTAEDFSLPNLDPGDSGTISADAAIAVNYDSSASPPAQTLCRSTAACDPDEDDGSKLAKCSSQIDAGVVDAGIEIELACRVSTNGAACARAGIAENGAACMTGNDCAAGYECVNSPGRCRHYCCDIDVCKTVGASNSNDTYFCDIQTQSATSALKVPVCSPVQACKLLSTTCGAGRTCGIVDPLAGVTSCVDAGMATVGESCELDHCAANLSCLGTAGKRTCQKICDPKDPSGCPTTQTCKQPWTVLKTDEAGICQ